MLRTFLFSILFAFSIGAAANGERPKPQPVEIEHNKTDRDGWIVAGVLAAGLVGVVIYYNKSEKEEKKVSLQPTIDGRGASATMEWRF